MKKGTKKFLGGLLAAVMAVEVIPGRKTARKRQQGAATLRWLSYALTPDRTTMGIISQPARREKRLQRNWEQSVRLWNR